MEDSKRKFDLEERTFAFTKAVFNFVKRLPRSLTNMEVAKQLIRSSGSVGANYIEASESLSRKDFAMRIKICRKESKESRYWLRLIECNEEDEPKQNDLMRESTELMKIFGSIVEKMK